MRKSIFTLAMMLGFISMGMAQEVVSSSSGNTYAGDFNNEVKVNFVNLILYGTFEVGYERYLSDDHSLEFKGFINDRFGFNSEGKGKKYKTNSVQVSMNFYFGESDKGNIYLFPLAKIRFGDFEEPADGGGVDTTDMTAFIIGVGAGYKWELSRNFAFGPYASVGRNFSDEVADRFTSIEFNAGFNLGYRF
ncbi:hypothetical protein FHS59_004261 [Algoriphagus iocasae]|uniref:DUF3575 domain-containing protein n=1 Tax=Algoriphagus iocasae TaxID=1836499 RepID=A0A841N1R3_9BACT|nr:DUF3575 domain-containing protein [Algoriphagus iocasae]MBB6328605.1 hypothetical protein [Algoriphagus iocasae]